MAVYEKKKQYDVVVVGGGMAGVCAAIASARHGAKTAIVQNRPVFGGNASSEVRMQICGASCATAKKDYAETGILMELLLANKARNPRHSFSVWDTVLWEKVRFQENLDCYLNTQVEEAAMDGSRIEQIRCHQTTTETDFYFSAQVFIDATGNGTLGKLSGADYLMGSEDKATYKEPNAPEKANTNTMGNTLFFKSVDRGRPVPFKKPFWAYSFTEEDLKYRHHMDTVIAVRDGKYVEYKEGSEDSSDVQPEFASPEAGFWWVEIGGRHKDIIAQGEEIRDELLKCVYGVWDHIKNGGDHGAENLELSWVGMVPGYRESRRLSGDYVLTENDVCANRVFDDAVAYGGWAMDEHTPGGIMDFDKLPARMLNFEGVYTIPYRCFYSRNVDNLMMAGRDISASKMAFGSTRVMGTCAVGGQAAGTAAAMAVEYSCGLRDVGKDHIEELQQLLLKDDCYIPGYRNTDPGDLARQARVSASSALPESPAANVINGISRDTPEGSNCWESAALAKDGESITLDLPEAKPLREIRITFDPNLTQDIMPAIQRALLKRQLEQLPLELVSDFEVICRLDGKEVYRAEHRENEERLHVDHLQKALPCDSVTVRVTKTYGHPNARIFEIRLYD